MIYFNREEWFTVLRYTNLNNEYIIIHILINIILNFLFQITWFGAELD